MASSVQGLNPGENLYKLLSENEYLDSKVLEKANADAKREKLSLYDVLVREDLISDENLGKLLSDYLKLPFVVLSKIVIELNLLRKIPAEVSEKQKAIVFGRDKDVVKIATFLPGNLEFLDMLAKKLNAKLKVHFATEQDISKAQQLYKKELKSAFDEMLASQVDSAKSSVVEAPVAKIVETLVEYAYENKASDIHIEPSEVDTLVRFRIDGVLADVLKLPKDLHDRVVTRIKVLSNLRTDEHLSAQDGKMQVAQAQEELDIRVSIIPIVDGEKVVLRLLSSHFRQFGLADLGMAQEDLGKVKDAFGKPYGMVLSTGPTGSGKTTTMYAILKILNTRDKNIATIEDPVEYEIEGLNQVQVNPKTNLTFADGLRSLLRQDPDVIYVGEIRDDETASIAINSATTGHLVLSTLHTNDAATALPRLIDMNIEPFLIASTVNVIIAQRLVRKICEKCKVSKEVSRNALAKPVAVKTSAKAKVSIKAATKTGKWEGEPLLDNLPDEMIKKYFGFGTSLRLYYGKGCGVCHQTGYLDRVGIFEVMVISKSIQELITSKADSEKISSQAQVEGMVTMLSDGLSKVQRGITTVEEVLRATKE